MKRSKLFKIILVGLMLISFSTFASDKKAETKAEEKIEFTNQTHCPVMGGKIDSSSYTDIQGQRVYHCCPGCSKSLLNNPDKYFKEAAAKHIVFENIQTTCPVSSKELTDKSTSIYFEGRTIKFCCEGCVEPFKKDAQKFLKAIDSSKDEKKAEMKHDDHSGHNH